MKKQTKILILNGPNLQLLGKREVEIYGETTLESLNAMLTAEAQTLGVQVEFFQSCCEGALTERIGRVLLEGGVDGIVFNPGAYSHSSIALRDAISAIRPVPVIEVHLSNIHAREEFRHRSVTAGAGMGVIAGFGTDSYFLALCQLVKWIGSQG